MCHMPLLSEIKCHGCCVTSRRNKMRAAEGGEEVIERYFVGEVDHGKARAHAVTITAKEIVVAQGNVKETS